MDPIWYLLIGLVVAAALILTWRLRGGPEGKRTLEPGGKAPHSPHERTRPAAR